MISQTSLFRVALSKVVCVLITAPLFLASLAFNATIRESSTQQSEYSNPIENLSFSGIPVLCFFKLIFLVGGSNFLPPIWS